MKMKRFLFGGKIMKEYRFDIGIYCKIFAENLTEAKNWAEGFADTFKDAVNATKHGESIDLIIKPRGKI